MIFGYRLGIVISGAGTLYLKEILSWFGVFLILSVFIVFLVLIIILFTKQKNKVNVKIEIF